MPETAAPLSPALMLFSPTWMRCLPQTAPALIRLLRRDSRVVLMDLALLHQAYRTFLHWHARNAWPATVSVPRA